MNQPIRAGRAGRTGRTGPWALVRASGLAAVLALVLSSSCATVTSLNEGCPGVYSGVKYNRGFEDSDLVTWKEQPLQELYLLVDLPFSAVLDTVLLPYTYFATPRGPAAPGPGCKAVEK